jgi:Resolvase, N terminal domain/Shedu protein SduA, C-terminal
VRNTWVFSQLTGSPVVLLAERAYVGGKLSNVGGSYVDYLVRNSLTDNVSLVEIKTPGAALCGGLYRSDSGIYAPGKDVAGGVVQVLGYRDKFLNHLNGIRAESDTLFHAYNPRCFLVVGHTDALADRILERLDQADVLFRSATEPFDTASSAGRMMVQMLGVFAEFERATIVERTIAGMQRKAERGEWVGGNIPFGYRLDADRHFLVPEPTEASVVPLLFQRYTERLQGSSALAKWLTERGLRTRQGKPFNVRRARHAAQPNLRGRGVIPGQPLPRPA